MRGVAPMIIGVGVDVVQIERLERALSRTPRLRERLFTSGEQQCSRMGSLAVRFAAKEAVAKALGAPGGLRWTDAEVVTDRAGRPALSVRGGVAQEADAQGVTDWHLSMSHDGGVATAIVVAEGRSTA